jgi:bifunctional DNA-binding transcriptional regulator/antitoxin component of YhaV-PrlF toxin-antitoxin module
LWENFYIVGIRRKCGIKMAVVAVDDRGRVTFPKETAVRERVVLIPAGSFYIVVPLPSKPEEYAGRWLKSAGSRKGLKAAAERLALKETRRRAKRRKQL